jgi:conjugative relaxase-like TrwC/TraI family protein
VLTGYIYKNPKQVIKYFYDHLVSGDYYLEDGKVEGRWFGEFCEKGGVAKGDRVEIEAFAALVLGLHAKTKKFLGQRKRSKGQNVDLQDYIKQALADPNKELREHNKTARNVAFDFVVSAPKSVSIVALVGGDARIIEAHQKAARAALNELENYVMTRVRRGLTKNTRDRRITKNFVAAQFTHTSSRELDPQLHTHGIVMNLTHDQAESRVKALDSYGLFCASQYGDAVYQNLLARELRAIGYDLEMGRHSIEISGVAKEIMKLFSKGKAKIEKRAAFLEAKGLTVGTRGRALIAQDIKKNKNREASNADLLAHQTAQLTEEQLRSIQALTAKTQGVAIPDEEDTRLLAKQAIDFAVSHVFERQSVATREELLRAALKFSMGRATIDEIKMAYAGREFIKRGDSVTTREERDRESKCIALVNEGVAAYSLPLGNPRDLSETLRPAQAKAAKKLLGLYDQFQFLRGVAGAGKTYTVKEILRCANFRSTHTVICAPTSSAADALRDEGLQAAITLQKLLLDGNTKQKLRNGFLVIDEAGLLSLRQMEAVIDLARESNTRVLFVGDTRQMHSVESGDALRALEKFSRLYKAEIRKITRQKDVSLRKAAYMMSDGLMKEAIDFLDKQGAIRQGEFEDRTEAVSEDYVNSVLAGKQTLCVAPTWKEIYELTDAIRDKLAERSALDRSYEQTLEVIHSLNFTQPQKAKAMAYEPGHIVSFHSSIAGFKQGELWRVKSVESEQLRLVYNGRELLVSPDSIAPHIDVLDCRQAQFTVGDKLMMKANFADSKSNRLVNGYEYKITNIKKDGSLDLERRGKNFSLPSSFRQFTHAYVVTPHAAQGRTSTVTIGSMFAKNEQALNDLSMLVSCTRSTEELRIYTNDTPTLKTMAAKTGHRKAVTELLLEDRLVAKRLQPVKLALRKSLDSLSRAYQSNLTRFSDLKKIAQIQKQVATLRDKTTSVVRTQFERAVEMSRRLSKQRDIEKSFPS